MLYGILKANKTGYSPDMFELLASERLNTDMNIKERERTGAFPMIFYADGTDLIDWSITGAAGGVGKLGDNYLKQTEVTIPSGSYGERVYTTTSWITARIGTFNSGQATTIGCNLHKSDNSNITPANVGKMYIVEGDGDPEAEGIELVIFQGGITQMGDDSRPSVYHLMRYGDDGTGNIQQIKPDGNAAYIPIRCGTALFELTPDTDYKFARVGGDADVEIQYVTGNGTRTVSVEFANTGLPAIPDGGTTTIADAQWCKMTTSERYNFSSSLLPVDNRAESYENCTAFADLKAGHYKVIAEAITKDSAWLSTMLLNDNVPYFMLIDDSNNKIISRTQIFQTESLWNHEEYEFTLSADAKVGLFYKAYYGYASSSTPPVNYIRFMIVDYDKTSVSFDISSSYGQLTGVSCWEPYRVTLPITIQHGDRSTDIELSIGTEFLGENDTVSLTALQPSIPTYSGKNIIRAATEVQPSGLYIKYNGTSQ